MGRHAYESTFHVGHVDIHHRNRGILSLPMNRGRDVFTPEVQRPRRSKSSRRLMSLVHFLRPKIYNRYLSGGPGLFWLDTITVVPSRGVREPRTSCPNRRNPDRRSGGTRMSTRRVFPWVACGALDRPSLVSVGWPNPVTYIARSDYYSSTHYPRWSKAFDRIAMSCSRSLQLRYGSRTFSFPTGLQSRPTGGSSGW